MSAGAMRYKLLIRIAALAAAIPIMNLRSINGAEAGIVFMTVMFYCGPYLLVALGPPKWASVQVGFSAGYSVSMLAALLIVLVFQLPFSTLSHADLRSLHLAQSADVILLAVAVITWLWDRKRLDNASAGIFGLLGLIYPFAVFLIEMVIASAIYH